MTRRMASAIANPKQTPSKLLYLLAPATPDHAAERYHQSEGDTMTERPEPFTATIEVENGGEDGTTFTVESDDFEHADYSCGPGLDLTITSDKERVSITVRQGMEEDDAGALAAALLRAIEAGRADAERRGYYTYLAEGEPEYGPPYEWESDGRLSADARTLLAELMVDSDMVGRAAEKFAGLTLTRPLPTVLAELDAAGLLRRGDVNVREVFTAHGSAWITAGSRRADPFTPPGHGLADALARVEGFVAGDDVWPLRIADLAVICAAARTTLDASPNPAAKLG